MYVKDTTKPECSKGSEVYKSNPSNKVLKIEWHTDMVSNQLYEKILKTNAIPLSVVHRTLMHASECKLTLISRSTPNIKAFYRLFDNESNAWSRCPKETRDLLLISIQRQ